MGICRRLLRTVKVSQSHVVEILEQINIDFATGSHKGTLRVRRTSACGKKMGDEDIDPGRIQLNARQSRSQGIFMGSLTVFFGQDFQIHVIRAEKRDSEKICRANSHRFVDLIEVSQEVNILILYKLREIGEPGCAVVVSGNNQNRDGTERAQIREKLAQKQYGLSGRYASIIDVSGHNQSVMFLPLQKLEQLIQKSLLLFE